jgi:hypothetical protein
MTDPGGPEERYAALVEALAAEPAVTFTPAAAGRPTFGSNALKVNGRIFAMLANGRLVVKLPAARVGELVERGQGQRFDPGHGRIMREWLSLDPSADEEWEHLTHEALQFVGSRPS